MRQLIVIIFSLICFSGFSQSRPVATIPSPRGDSAFAEYGYLQSLVLGIDAVGDTMIRPRLAGSSRTWIHGGVTEVWKWDGTKWVITGTSGGAGGGTVTNVSATNTYALSWVITNPTTTPNLTGTLDTALLLTQNHFYNSIDSLILTFNSNYVKYTDTASMLSHYVRRVLAGTNVTVDNTNPQYPIVSSTAGGSGTVTSVGLAAPSIFTVTNSPVTTSGTLTFSPNNAQGDLIYGSAANTLAYLNKSTTANQFLKNSGTNNNPAWATIAASDIGSGAALTKVDDTNVTLTLGGSPSTSLLAATSLTLGWTGVLGVSRGGTSYGSYTTGDMLYASGSGTLSKLSIGSTGQHLVVVGGVPVWRDTAVVGGSGVTTWSAGTTGFTPNSATSGAVTLAGVLVEANGGTHQSTYTTGDMLYASASNTLSKLPIGTNGQHLIVSGGIPTWRDSLANNSWLLIGNAGTTAASNFIGTTDAISFRTRTNNVERMIVDSVGFVGINKTVPTAQLHIVGGSGTPALGSELINTANYTSTGWTTVVAGTYTHNTGNTTALTNTAAAGAGTGYAVTFTVTGRTAGTFTVTFGGVSSATITPSSGTYYGEIPISATTTGTLSVAPTTDFNGTITLSIKAITGNSTPILIAANNSNGSLEFRTDTINNLGIGASALARTFAGLGTLGSKDGANNTAIGSNALSLNVSGNGNLAIGTSALAANLYGNANIAIGVNALTGNSTGAANVAIGANSATSSNTTSNTVIGVQAGVVSGGSSVHIGYTTGTNNTGVNSVFIGTGAGILNSQVAVNSAVFIGGSAGNRTTGGGNVGIGLYALGNDNSTSNSGTYNTALGYLAGYSANVALTGRNNIIIGSNGDLPSKTSDNQVQIWVNAIGGSGGYNALTRFTGGQWLLNNTTSAVTSAPNTSAYFEMNGTTGGFKPPVLTTTQRDALTGVAGLAVYNSTLNTNDVYDGTGWRSQANGLGGSATLDFGSTAAQTSTDLTITLSGVADGDAVFLGAPNGSTSANSLYTAWVSAANTVTVRFLNIQAAGAIDPASGTFKVFVKKN